MKSEEENKEDTLETKKNSAVSTEREEITGKVGKRNKRKRPSKDRITKEQSEKRGINSRFLWQKERETRRERRRGEGESNCQALK